MLKSPKSRGYVLLEALIGLMVLTVIVSLISFMMGQLYHRQQLKGCFLAVNGFTSQCDLSCNRGEVVKRRAKADEKSDI